MSINCSTTLVSIQEKEVTGYVLQTGMKESSVYTRIDEYMNSRKKTSMDVASGITTMALQSYEVEDISFKAPKTVHGAPRMFSEYSTVSPSGCDPCPPNSRPSLGYYGSWQYVDKKIVEPEIEISVPAIVKCTAYYNSNKEYYNTYNFTGLVDESGNSLPDQSFTDKEKFMISGELVFPIKVSLDMEVSKYRRTSTETVYCENLEKLSIPIIPYL